MKEKIQKESFCFLDNYIGIDCCKFSLLQRVYLWSAVNMLTSSPKILDITKRDISNFIFLRMLRKNDKSSAVQISACFRPFSKLAVEGCSERGLFRRFSNHIFLNDIFLLPPVISEIHKLWGSSFFSNVQNFMGVLGMKQKIEEEFLVS